LKITQFTSVSDYIRSLQSGFWDSLAGELLGLIPGIGQISGMLGAYIKNRLLEVAANLSDMNYTGEVYISLRDLSTATNPMNVEVRALNTSGLLTTSGSYAGY
jgi:hypothetical protein